MRQADHESTLKLPLPGQSTTNPETRFDKGLEVQERMSGDRIDTMSLGGCGSQLMPFIGHPRALNAIRVVNEGTAA